VERDFTKFKYPSPLERLDSPEGRRYITPEGHKVPSVTTILDQTKDKTYLNEWIKRVGVQEARRIKECAAHRGTYMHEILEHYFLDTEPPKKISPEAGKFKRMAKVIKEQGLIPDVSDIYAAEVRLHCKDLYAGTTDGIGLYKGNLSIIDFKQSNRDKREDWIQDYFIQLAAYATAHNWMMGTNIRHGVIMICTVELKFQKFEMTPDNFDHYQKEWFKRIVMHKKRAVIK
tara:strand:- start:5642 stop:6331 length:690 start_codon:yes stop_codon:yes gene_type:complete